MNLFNTRVYYLKKAMRKAKNPEFKDLWSRKLKELITNESDERDARKELYLLGGE